MKKHTFRLLLFATLTIFLFSCGASKVNVTDNYILSVKSFYDSPLPEYSDDYSVFWDYILNHNEAFNRYSSRDSRFVQKTKKEFLSEVDNLPMVYDFAEEYMETGRRHALMFSGDRYTDDIRYILLCPDDMIDAYCYPNGYIYIHRGLAERFDEDWHAYAGVVAHEIAHILLKHAERHNFDIQKRERNEEITRGVAGGLLGAGAIAGSLSMANSGVDMNTIEDWTDTYTNNAIELGGNINIALKKHSLIKKYEYSREQEVEADIIAVLFLQWIGKPVEPYIDLLSKLPSTESGLYSTHPDVKFRVSFLNEIIGKPDRSFKVDGRIYHLDGKQVDRFLQNNPAAEEFLPNKKDTKKNPKGYDDNIYN